MQDTSYRQNLAGVLALCAPKGFWESIQRGFQQMYPDAFAAIEADNSIVKQHKLYALQQSRYVKADSLLFSVADKFGLSVSMTAIEKNSSYYCYVAAENIGLTQSYIPTTDALPNPATYRDALAEQSANPRLDLGDEPAGILSEKDLYCVIAHNPVGKTFDLEKQKLGTVQVCVPTPDFRCWAAQIYLPEILAIYAPDVAQSDSEVRQERKIPIMRDGSQKTGAAE